MINRKATIRWKGYDPNDLASNSGKRVWANCDICGKGRWVFKDAYRDLCKSCSHSEISKPGFVAEEDRFVVGTGIDRITTIEKMGYDPIDLKSKSGRKVWCVCLKCGYGRWLNMQSYCSQCRLCFQSPKGNESSSYKGRVIKICEYCKTEFEVIMNSKTGSDRRFCSRRCADKWRLGKSSGEENGNYKEKIIKSCEICNKKFAVQPCYSYRRFCSQECYGVWLSENNCGENNPRYNPNKEYDPYCSKFDETCRESNREKYDRCCFLCGLLEEGNITLNGLQRRLSVHHVDMNKNQGCDDVKWKLIPLCMKCHSIAHTMTWEARIEWLLNNVYNGCDI
jgi:hypothetical protein